MWRFVKWPLNALKHTSSKAVEWKKCHRSANPSSSSSRLEIDLSGRWSGLGRKRAKKLRTGGTALVQQDRDGSAVGACAPAAS